MRNFLNTQRIHRLAGWLCGACALLAADAAELASPSPAAVSAAISAPYIRFNRTIAGGAYTNGAYFGGASITLAVASHAGNTAADTRLLGQIRYTLTAGNEPAANGGYPAQHEKQVTAMFVIVKQTPRIWEQLTAAEKAKIDRIMKATFVASAFTTSDNNPFIKAGTQQYTLDGDSNLDRAWNPNYREGMAGGILVGVAYFGGPAAAEAILTGYSHSAFVAELNANGLPNAYQTFNWKAANPTSGAPSASQIETAVRTYRYFGMPLSDYLGIYEELVVDTYRRNVNAGINNGTGINGAGKIATGAATLPNPGAVGMLKEFDASDSGGARSSFIYAFDGYRPHLANVLSLVVAGLWPQGSELANGAAALMNIGNTDLWYKAEKGYISYAKGASQGLQDYGDFGSSHGFVYNRSLWDDVLKPYLAAPGGGGPGPDPGFAAGARIQSGASAKVHSSASATAVLTGVLPSGTLGTLLEGPSNAGGVNWWRAVFDNGVPGWIDAANLSAAPASETLTTTAGLWQNLALPPQTGTFTISFNMVPGASGIDCVTGLSTTAAAAFTDLAVALRFSTGNVVDARNGGSYQAANVLAYQPGVVYRAKLTVNLATHTYSATVTPAGGQPVTIASNYAFRNGQTSVTTLANLAASSVTGSHKTSGVRLGAESVKPAAPAGLRKSAN
jgi:hypothetical protein